MKAVIKNHIKDLIDEYSLISNTLNDLQLEVENVIEDLEDNLDENPDNAVRIQEDIDFCEDAFDEFHDAIIRVAYGITALRRSVGDL